MRLLKRAAFAAAAVALAGGMALATGTAPALAGQQQQICGNLGSGYCLNDWNNRGSGFPVLMYYGGNPNENFTVQFINRCGGHSYVTAPGTGFGNAYCPFASHQLDLNLAGASIVQLHYQFTNLCVAANTANAQAVMGDCNATSNGTGGSVGTVQIIQGGAFLVNLHYTTGNSEVGLQSGGNPQKPVYMNSATMTEWGPLP
jgi:hypothetical protein